MWNELFYEILNVVIQFTSFCVLMIIAMLANTLLAVVFAKQNKTFNWRRLGTGIFKSFGFIAAVDLVAIPIAAIPILLKFFNIPLADAYTKNINEYLRLNNIITSNDTIESRVVQTALILLIIWITYKNFIKQFFDKLMKWGKVKPPQIPKQEVG